MDAPVVLDTNILIGILNGRFDRSLFSQGSSIHVSAVTVMELYALAGMSDQEETMVGVMLDEMICEPVTRQIAKLAGTFARTRRRGKSDMLIAATAVLIGVPLMSKDARGFKNIPGLKLV